jgi:hypothetical protein
MRCTTPVEGVEDLLVELLSELIHMCSRASIGDQRALGSLYHRILVSRPFTENIVGCCCKTLALVSTAKIVRSCTFW